MADLNHNCVVASISSYSCLSSYLLYQLSCIFSVLSSILDSYSISSIYCQPCSREHLSNLTVLTCQRYIAIDQYSSTQKWCLVLQLQNGLKIKGFKMSLCWDKALYYYDTQTCITCITNLHVSSSITTDNASYFAEYHHSFFFFEGYVVKTKYKYLMVFKQSTLRMISNRMLYRSSHVRGLLCFFLCWMCTYRFCWILSVTGHLLTITCNLSTLIPWWCKILHTFFASKSFSPQGEEGISWKEIEPGTFSPLSNAWYTTATILKYPSPTGEM